MSSIFYKINSIHLNGKVDFIGIKKRRDAKIAMRELEIERAINDANKIWAANEIRIKQKENLEKLKMERSFEELTALVTGGVVNASNTSKKMNDKLIEERSKKFVDELKNIDWDKIQNKYGKREYPIKIESFREFFVELKIKSIRPIIPKLIYDILSKELDNAGLQITKRAKMATIRENGLTKHTYLLYVSQKVK